MPLDSTPNFCAREFPRQNAHCGFVKIVQNNARGVFSCFRQFFALTKIISQEIWLDFDKTRPKTFKNARKWSNFGIILDFRNSSFDNKFWYFRKNFKKIYFDRICFHTEIWVQLWNEFDQIWLVLPNFWAQFCKFLILFLNFYFGFTAFLLNFDEFFVNLRNFNFYFSVFRISMLFSAFWRIFHQFKTNF